MKIKNNQKILLAIGLFLASMNLLLIHYLNLPDFMAGLITGISIGLEIIAIVLLKRVPKTSCN
ncbi:MAG: hypothetical protein ABIP95_09135 [Pelobium sp.]